MTKIRSVGDIRQLKFVMEATGANGVVERGLTVDVTRAGGLTVMPPIFEGKASRHTVECLPIDYGSKPSVFTIKDQTYLGTANSVYSDNRVDLYLISNKVIVDVVDNGTPSTKEVTEQFILAIPSLLFVVECDTMKDVPSLSVDGVIIGVTSSGSKSANQTTVSIGDLDTAYTYLDTLKEVTLPKLDMTVMCLTGTDYDSTFNSIEVYVTGGQINGSSNLPTQLIVLGDVTDLFTNASEGVRLDLKQLKSTSINHMQFSSTSAVVTSGTLVIPLNF